MSFHPKRYWSNFWKLKRETLGNLFIAIGSLFVFFSWIAHDLINAKFAKNEMENTTNQFSLKLFSMSRDYASLFNGVMRLEKIRMEDSSMLRNYEVYEQFIYNSNENQSIQANLLLGNNFDEIALLDTLNNLYNENYELYNSKNLNELAKITDTLTSFNINHFTSIDNNRYTYIGDTEKKVKFSEHLYQMFYFISMALFCLGFLLKKWDAIKIHSHMIFNR